MNYRIHELEFLLFDSGLSIEEIHTSVFEFSPFSFLLPLIKAQMRLKEKRSMRKKGLDCGRIHRLMLSKELLYGRHLILKARKLGRYIGGETP